MSTSETITRTDLTNILNQVLPIRSETPCDTVTLPYTPTANGLMIVLIRSASSARTYQSFTNTLPTLVDNYGVSDAYWSQVVYVQRGKQVALSTQSNIKSATYYYIPLDGVASAVGGGVQTKTLTGTTDANGNLSLGLSTSGASSVISVVGSNYVYTPFVYSGNWYAKVVSSNSSSTPIVSESVSVTIKYI